MNLLRGVCIYGAPLRQGIPYLYCTEYGKPDPSPLIIPTGYVSRSSC